MEAVVLNEEFAKAGAPLRADFFGDTLVGPTILQWGTEEQKKFFLPKILSGEIAWCQGFSEPDAGSDLANLGTKAVLDGDEWVINGQKIWTTQGFVADYIFVLCRTDPDASKHKGISYLLCPMDQPGIEVRPIHQVDGAAEFAEVFFTDARCPKDNVVGGVNNGWNVAMTTLGFERGTSATTGYRRFEKELEVIIDKARANGRIDDPFVRQGLARAWSKVQIMRINGLRTLTSIVQEKKDFGRRRARRHQQDVLERVPPAGHEPGHRHPWAWRVRSSPAIPTSRRPCPATAPAARATAYPASVLQSSFFFSRSETIWGGTVADPAQHRGRAGPGPAQGAEGRRGGKVGHRHSPPATGMTEIARSPSTLKGFMAPSPPPTALQDPPVVPEPTEVRRRHRSWLQRMILGTGILALVAILAGVAVVGYGWYRFNQINKEKLSLGKAGLRPSRRTSWWSAPTAGTSSTRATRTTRPFNGGNEATGGQRSDTIMVVRVDPKSHTVDMVSFPRDLWVPIAGHRGEPAHQHRLQLERRSPAPDRHHPARLRHPHQPLRRGRLRRLPGRGRRHRRRPDVLRRADARHQLGAERQDGRVRDPRRRAGAGLRPVPSPPVQRPRAVGTTTPPPTSAASPASSTSCARSSTRPASQATSLDLLGTNDLLQASVKNLTVDGNFSFDTMLALAKEFKSFTGDQMVTHTLPVTPWTTNGGAAVLRLDQSSAQPIFDLFSGKRRQQPHPGRRDALGPQQQRGQRRRGQGPEPRCQPRLHRHRRRLRPGAIDARRCTTPPTSRTRPTWWPAT